MGAFTYIETDTGTNVDISGATAVGAYTANGDKLIMVDVSIDAVAGNGDYVMYVTRQINGAGSAYVILPKTTMTAASGETAISAQSGWITVRNGDVLTCYVDGLAGDTSTPDWTTRWFELAGVTAAAVADAVWDEAKADHVVAGSVGKQLSDAALEATLTAIKGENWTNETLKAIKDVISALSLGGVDPEVVAGAVLDALMADHQVSGSVAKAIANIKTKTDLISVDKIVITPPAEVVNGTDISILRGDTLEFEVSDLGNLEDASAIDWTVKWWAVDTDSKALVRLRTEAGLLRLNGEEANSDLGAIVVTDPETGIVEVHLEEAATAMLVPGTCVYDLQLIRAGKVRTLVTGKVTVTADVTRAVS